jgi:hypothetical protein
VQFCSSKHTDSLQNTTSEIFKHYRRESDRSVTLTGDEAKEEWIYTSNIPYVFTAWCLFKERSNLRSDSDSGRLIKLYNYIKLYKDNIILIHKDIYINLYTDIKYLKDIWSWLILLRYLGQRRRIWKKTGEKFHTEELRNLHSSTNTRFLKSRKSIGWGV